MVIGISVGVIGGLIGIYIYMFNTLNRRKNQIDNAFSSLDTLFIKRNDLIPNLIATIKEYMTFESDTLSRITELRAPRTRTAENYAENGEVDKIMRQIMLQVENYPDLKANQQFLNLQYSFNECEEQIAAGRRYLSSSITDYNDVVTTFPANIVAGFSGMKKHEWERATEAQRQNVNIQELFR